MAQRQENRHYLLWLALGTVCIALVMAGLLALQLTQSRAIRKSVELQADSVTALTFQLEREFLRTRSALEAAGLLGAPRVSSILPFPSVPRRGDQRGNRCQIVQLLATLP